LGILVILWGVDVALTRKRPAKECAFRKVDFHDEAHTS